MEEQVTSHGLVGLAPKRPCPPATDMDSIYPPKKRAMYDYNREQARKVESEDNKKAQSILDGNSDRHVFYNTKLKLDRFDCQARMRLQSDSLQGIGMRPRSDSLHSSTSHYSETSSHSSASRETSPVTVNMTNEFYDHETPDRNSLLVLLNGQNLEVQKELLDSGPTYVTKPVISKSLFPLHNDDSSESKENKNANVEASCPELLQSSIPNEKKSPFPQSDIPTSAISGRQPFSEDKKTVNNGNKGTNCDNKDLISVGGDEQYRKELVMKLELKANDEKCNTNPNAFNVTESTNSKNKNNLSRILTDVTNCMKSQKKSSVRKSNVQEIYKCSVCNKEFRQSGNFHSHMQLHMETNRLCKCGVCGFDFDDSDSLQTHMRSQHTGSHPYKCEHCSREFSQFNNLRRHLRVHREKTFKCNLCDRVFNEEFYLKMHMGTHTGERIYRCGVCNACFSSSHELKSHVKTHSPSELHVCNICGKAFSKACVLRQHKKAHSGERPHKCSSCLKTFIHRHHLTMHMRSHTANKPYTCDLCGKVFSQTSHLYKHMRQHDEENIENNPNAITEAAKKNSQKMMKNIKFDGVQENESNYVGKKKKSGAHDYTIGKQTSKNIDIENGSTTKVNEMKIDKDNDKVKFDHMQPSKEIKRPLHVRMTNLEKIQKKETKIYEVIKDNSNILPVANAPTQYFPAAVTASASPSSLTTSTKLPPFTSISSHLKNPMPNWTFPNSHPVSGFQFSRLDQTYQPYGQIGYPQFLYDPIYYAYSTQMQAYYNMMYYKTRTTSESQYTCSNQNLGSIPGNIGNPQKKTILTNADVNNKACIQQESSDAVKHDTKVADLSRSNVNQNSGSSAEQNGLLVEMPLEKGNYHCTSRSGNTVTTESETKTSVNQNKIEEKSCSLVQGIRDMSEIQPGEKGHKQNLISCTLSHTGTSLHDHHGMSEHLFRISYLGNRFLGEGYSEDNKCTLASANTSEEKCCEKLRENNHIPATPKPSDTDHMNESDIHNQALELANDNELDGTATAQENGEKFSVTNHPSKLLHNDILDNSVHDFSHRNFNLNTRYNVCQNGFKSAEDNTVDDRDGFWKGNDNTNFSGSVEEKSQISDAYNRSTCQAHNLQRCNNMRNETFKDVTDDNHIDNHDNDLRSVLMKNGNNDMKWENEESCSSEGSSVNDEYTVGKDTTEGVHLNSSETDTPKFDSQVHQETEPMDATVNQQIEECVCCDTCKAQFSSKNELKIHFMSNSKCFSKVCEISKISEELGWQLLDYYLCTLGRNIENKTDRKETVAQTKNTQIKSSHVTMNQTVDATPLNENLVDTTEEVYEKPVEIQNAGNQKSNKRDDNSLMYDSEKIVINTEDSKVKDHLRIEQRTEKDQLLKGQRTEKDQVRTGQNTDIIAVEVTASNMRDKYNSKPNELQEKHHNQTKDDLINCQFCGETFQEEKLFLDHLTEHSLGQPYMCVLCKRSFTHKHNLKRHMMSHNEKSVECNVCGRKFKESFYLQMHMKVHSDENSQTCDICEEVILKSDMSEHMNSHLKPIEENPTYAQIAGRVKEILNEKNVEVLDLSLKKKITKESLMKLNVEQLKMFMMNGKNNEVIEKEVYLSELSQKIKDQGMSNIDIGNFNSTEHKLEMEKENQKYENHLPTSSKKKTNFQKCELCQSVFKNKRDLENHLGTVHNGERSHVCQTCGKGFKKSRILRQHEKIHSRKRYFKCDKCGKEFINSSEIQSHFCT